MRRVEQPYPLRARGNLTQHFDDTSRCDFSAADHPRHCPVELRACAVLLHEDGLRLTTAIPRATARDECARHSAANASPERPSDLDDSRACVAHGHLSRRATGYLVAVKVPK